MWMSAILVPAPLPAGCSGNEVSWFVFTHSLAECPTRNACAFIVLRGPSVTAAWARRRHSKDIMHVDHARIELMQRLVASRDPPQLLFHLSFSSARLGLPSSPSALESLRSPGKSRAWSRGGPTPINDQPEAHHLLHDLAMVV
jgi:hypothetical protein